MAYSDILIEETSELKTPVITLAKIKQRLNAEQPGSVKGTGTYEITGVKYNGQDVEGTLKVPDDGEITLQIETDTVSEDSKFYGLILGKYYEIILENSEIKLGDEKSLSEIEAGATVSELTATLEKENGANTNVDIVIDQEQKKVMLKGKGVNTGRGTGIIKISYGNTRNIGIDVVETFTVTVQAEQENNVPKGIIISPSVATQKYASGSVIILQTTANEGLKLKDWYDGTNVVGETNQCNYTISKNAIITARYEVKKLYGEQVLLNGGNAIIVKTVGTTNYTIEDNWKLFYIDDDDNDDSTLEYVHLIYGDYYPADVQTEITADNAIFVPAHEYNSSTSKYDTDSKYEWSVNSCKNRLTLLQYLKNNRSYAEANLDTSTPTENFTSWTDLATALTGSEKVLNGKMIRVQGAPDITMWKNSWNEQGYTELALDDSGNGVIGYNIRLKTSAANSNSNYYIDLNSYDGYQDRLYFLNSNKSSAYWLASPGGRGWGNVCGVLMSGKVLIYNDYACINLSARPIVSIMKSDFQSLFPNISISKPTNN